MLILKEEWQGHEKIKKAVYLARSKAVKHFWLEMISEAANYNTDGVIAVYRLDDVATSCGIDLETADRYIRACIDASVKKGGAGLLHDAESLKQCQPCRTALKEQAREPGPDDVVVHNFLLHNPAKADKTKMGRARNARKNWLDRKGDGLKVEVYRRDQGLCRYCGIRPSETSTRNDRLEHDHLDPNPLLEPNNGNFLANVAVSCKACNTRKGARTPTEAGMTIWAAGTTSADIAAGTAFAVSSLDEIAPASSGIGSGSAPGRTRVGSGSGAGQSGSPTNTRRTTPKKSTKGRSSSTSPPEAQPP